MRLLIAGWQGQIAKALTSIVPARDDIEACAIGRPALDICEVRTIERALSEIKPDLVINTAAYTDVDAAEAEFARAMALNCEGARMLAASAARRDIPILHLSTDYVFNGAAHTPYTESDATEPTTAYGRSKLAGEIAVRDANPKHIILRTAWIYSAHGRNFVKTIFANADAGKPLRVVNDQFGSPTYAPHLVDAMLTVASHVTRHAGRNSDAWGIFHAAGSGSASWHDVACAALRQSPRLAGRAADCEAISSRDYPTVAPRPAYTVLDSSKMARTFGVRLPAWQDGVAACVARIEAA